ncbi:Metallo-hydrolase/oxidoreductase [Auriscalpium vulgare]|uniref:Metallo-hydrolase/oxidoreductase n=1 Tax=Auriscalpium vulgare TaxID=40419 RepID=A0ACB8RN06_9AGAM|nr:Metallo-hydrolase/oxidoreductase [Auriscalpium vulgare]
MSQWMNVTFLGTCSGGGPSDTRNCSSLVLDVVGDGSLWMVDCAEGTLRQFAQQPAPRQNQRALKVGKVTHVFITHMHADHIMGLVTFLRNVLGISPELFVASTEPPTVNIYGPSGLRLFLRSNLQFTRTRTADRYAVHELLTREDDLCTGELHSSEAEGRDIVCGEDGLWRDVAVGRSSRGEIHVQAGPIEHRDPCIGYIFHEPKHASAPRKIVVLGDTSSPAALTPLIWETPGRVALLVHEATDAHIPAVVDAALARRRSEALVQGKVDAKGHSTPAMAGRWAGEWGAQRLVLNHIGARFPAPIHTSPAGKKYRTAILDELAHQATDAWRATVKKLNKPVSLFAPPTGLVSEREQEAIVATDFLTVSVSPSGQSEGTDSRWRPGTSTPARDRDSGREYTKRRREG